uniref:Telomerase reverse transcriptase n=1 Tax=Fagus sylvatica TaxID=28930 RepID=A0A2N9FAF5_FAGSY
MPKKRRVPEVLWRLFRDRARSLACTIVSLLPPPPSLCLCCTGSQCLGCSGAEAMSFLMRDDDPVDYLKLLNQCFVVVSDNAPPLSLSYSHSRWPQPQSNHASPIKELLSSSAWCLLLERVGDDVMFYLLNYTSIFLPVPYKKHHQVTGSPISDLCLELSKRKLESQYHHTSLDHCGSKKKSALDDNVYSILEIQKFSSSSTVDDPPISLDCVSSDVRSCSRSFSQLHGNKRSRTSLSEAATPITGIGTNNTEGDSNKELQESSNQIAAKSVKRSRPFSWQRRRKRRHLNVEETSVKTSFATILTDKDSISGRLQYDVNISLNRCEKLNGTSFSHNDGMEGEFVGSRLTKCVTNLPIENERYHSLVKLLKRLIHRTQCCQHLRLLDKHCPIPALDSYANGKSSTNFEGNESKKNVPEKSHGFNIAYCKETLEATEPQFEANKSYCLRSQVVSFIWAVIRSIVPIEFLGTSYNWRMLRRNIAMFIRLRRFEKFSLKQCMHKLKASRFPFLSTQHFSSCLSNQVLKYETGESVDMHKGSRRLDAAHVLKHKLLESWIFWLFSCLVVPLVQANFYVTETEFGKQDVYYYRKSVWEKLIDKAVTCLKDQGYRDLDAATVGNIIDNRLFGFSKLRLRPKENGMRTLSNLKAPSRFPSQKSSLEDQSCGTHGKGKIRPNKVHHFKSVNLALRDTHAVLKGIQLEEPEKLGSSVFDYNDVYRKLCPFLIGLKNRLTTMPGVFVVVSDVLKAFDSINQDKLLSVMKDVIQKDAYLLKQSHQVLCTGKSLWVHENLVLMDHNMSTTKVTSSVPFRSLHTVLVNQEWSRHVKKEELFFNLKEHVKYNVLQLYKKFFLQGVGIPQGSIVSSLLCSFYYGHLERNVISPFLEKTCEPTAKDISRRHISRDASAQESSEDKFYLSPSYILLRFIDDFLLISTSKKQAAGFFSRLRRGFREYNCYMNDDKFSLNFDIGHLSGIPSNRVYVGEDGNSFLRWSGLLVNCCTLEVQADYTKIGEAPSAVAMYKYVLIRRRMRSAYRYCGFRPILQLEEEEVEWLGLYAYIQEAKSTFSSWRKRSCPVIEGQLRDLEGEGRSLGAMEMYWMFS